MKVTRRAVLGSLIAGSAQVLLTHRLHAAQNAAPAGALELSLAAFSPGTLRISIAPVNDQAHLSELAVVDPSDTAVLYPFERAHSQELKWGKYSIKVSENPVRVAVSENGKLRQEIRFQLDSTNVQFNLDGPAFGLGEGVHPYDRRGTRDAMLNGQHAPDLLTFGARVPIPWVISPKGWGVFVGQPQGSFSFTQTEATFSGAEASSTRNVYLLLGDTPSDVMKEYAGLTGHPQLPPLWSFGYQQSHRTLAGKDEILSIAKTFRDKKLPCDAVIYLGTGFCPSGWNTGHGSFTFNESVFPDPAAVIKQLHDENLKIIVHIVPPGDFHGTVKDTGAEAQTPGDAVPYWAKHDKLLKLGIDGWWPDEGDRLSVYARYQRNKMYWDGSLQSQPDKRPFALHRNGYAGLQSFGWLWSGDTFSTWDALKSQIMVGINIGLSGIPYWGTDTGGFVPTIEYSPELFVRWFQFSTFCPSFRSHGRSWHLHLPWGWGLGDSGPKEVEGEWVASWPPQSDLHRTDVEQICRKFLNLRYQLLPYTYSMAAQAHANGMPMIRALWLSHPDDDQAQRVEDSYLWGDSIIVAPIHTKDSTERSVYLPAGPWWNFWTEEKLEGNGTITAKAGLDSMPLFVRAGAIVPTGPVKQHTAERSEEPVDLRVYVGADGKFDWYDDDGASFAYEQGQYMLVHCDWDDKKRTLTLQRDSKSRLGSGRQVRVRLVGSEVMKAVTLSEGISKVQF
jgi:alpha-glucosidase (family GH31 glycosyl hydrolase)